jgi:rfaE bifunctional protein nucleotidyltransferase chain/domain
VRIVLAHGCFDCLHYGHLLHLEEARKLGERLVVSITADKYIAKPGRPIYNERARSAMLRALRCVDDVVVAQSPTAVESIRRVMPRVFVKGLDYCERGIIAEELVVCREIGCDIAYTPTEKYSTTDLIRRLSCEA